MIFNFNFSGFSKQIQQSVKKCTVILKQYLLARGFNLCKVASWHLFKTHFQSLTHTEHFDHVYVHKNVIYKYEFAQTSAVSGANRKQHCITNKHINSFYTDTVYRWIKSNAKVSFSDILVDINNKCTCIVHLQKYSHSM